MELYHKIVLLGLFVIFLIQTTTTSTVANGFRITNSEDINQKAIDQIYDEARSLINPDQQRLLEEILAADEVFLERQTRGVVDQILAALSGAALSGLVGPVVIVGTNPGNPPAATNIPIAPAATNPNPNAGIINPMRNASVNESNPAQGNFNTTMTNDNYLFNQISKVVINSATRNVTGIVDNALKIGTPAPIRNLVNGIVAAAYCNGVRRLLGRC